MKLGAAIAKLRDERGLSQDQLADLCEISKPSVSRIESEKQWPAKETLERIAKELGVGVYQIFIIAEGISLPVAHESDEQRIFRGTMESLDTQSRYLIEALASKLSGKKKD